MNVECKNTQLIFFFMLGLWQIWDLVFITRNATIPTLEELAIVPQVCKY